MLHAKFHDHRSFCSGEFFKGFDISLLLAALLELEITAFFLWLSLPVRSGSLKRIWYSKLYSLAQTLLLNNSSALKGTHFYILFLLYMGMAAILVMCYGPFI